MLRWIIRSALNARLLAAALAAALIAVGVVSFRSMPADVLPEFAPPTVEVQTEALGLSASEVEQLITVPVEQDLLAGVPWLDTIRSESMTGLSSIEMTFDPGTNLLDARQVVQERISQAAGLPNVSGMPQMLPPRSATTRVMMVRLSSGRLSAIEMSVLARWTIRPRLLGVPGVANVTIWGQRERQLQVQVDPRRLRLHGVSLQNVIETTGNALWASPLSFLEASTPGTGGFIDTNNQRLSVQHLQPIETAKDLAVVPIEGAPGLRLQDVANVVEDHQPLIGDAVFPDGGGGLLLVVEKFPAANTLEVTRGVEDALDGMRPGLPGMAIDPTVYRPATYIQTSFGNLFRALAIGFLLLVLALLLLLASWRHVLVVVVAVAASLAAAGIVLFLLGATVNAMALAGLVMALGVIVDDAVADVENIGSRLRRDRMKGGTEPPARLALAAALETRGAAGCASLVILIAALPVFFLSGESGAFFPPIALSYVLAVAASMVVALLVTPALGLVLLAGATRTRGESAIARRLRHGYGNLLSRAAGRPRPVYATAAVVALASLVLLPLLDRSTVPPFRDGDVIVRLQAAAPGTSLPEMDRITARVGAELRSLPGVRSVGAHVGRAIMSDQVVDVGSGELWVHVDPSADYEATLAAINRTVRGYPGLRSAVETYPNQRVSSVLTPTDPPIVVRVFGQDLGVLRSKAEEIRRAIAGIDGVVNPRVSPMVEEPTASVVVDLAAAKRFGVKPGDVRRTAATLLSGTIVGSLYEQQMVFDVVVWGTPESRASLTSISNLLVDRPDGGLVRLAKLADVRVQPYPAVVRHQDISRYLDVTAGVSERSPGAVAADVGRRLQAVSFPLEHHAELVGNYADRQAAHGRFLAVAAAVAVGIFLLLQAATWSWRLGTMALLSIAASLSGGVLAAFASGRPVSLGTLAGLMVVFGLSTRFTVTLVRRVQRLQREEGIGFGPELVLRGAGEHFLPVVASAAATALALVPIVWLGPIPGLELVHPMAVVILGGLVTALLVTLFVVAPLYLRFGSAATVGMAGSGGVALLPDEEPAPRT